jgi:cell division septal protein FtsQ
MTRVRKIGATPVGGVRTRRRGGGRILRGIDGRPVRARRLAAPVSLRVRLLRVGAVVLLFCFFVVLWTRPVREIEVQGVWLSSPDLVTGLFGPELGRRWITRPTKTLEDRLEADPWIDAAQVMRAPGSKLLVRIRETEPLFRAELDDVVRLVDRNGVLLPPAGDLIVDALPRIQGLAFEDGAMTGVERRRFKTLLHALDASGWIWTEGLDGVDLTDPDAVVLRSRDGVEVVVRIDQVHDQLTAAAMVWDRLESSTPSRVDLRFENQIVLSR